YARVVRPDPCTHATAANGPDPGGSVNVPESVADPLLNRTSSWRPELRFNAAPSTRDVVASNRAVPAAGARVAKPEPTTKPAPDWYSPCTSPVARSRRRAGPYGSSTTARS